jgi:hypothetical protein
MEAQAQVSLEAQVKALRDEVLQLVSEVHTLQRQQSSRRGPEGPKGDSVVGPAGKDAILVVKTDTATNTVHVFDESGNEKAAIVPVVGPEGKVGLTGEVGERGLKGEIGPAGHTPSEDEIAAVVRKLFSTIAKAA